MSRAGLAILLVASAAAAQERFGARGTVSPAGGFGFAYLASGGANDVFASVDPSVMYFVSDGLAVGGSVHLSASSSGPTYGYGAAPAVGFNFWLADRVSIFPQALVRASWLRREDSGSTSRLITAVAFAPVLFHVTPHFFLGFGPQVTHDLDATPLVIASTPGLVSVLNPVKATTVGLQSTIGGWF